MLFLAKLSGILVMVWFYISAKKQDASPINWAIIGLIGYWISWWIANKVILSALIGMFSKSSVIVFLVTQIPVACAIFIVFIVRKKLIHDAQKNNSTSQ